MYTYHTFLHVMRARNMDFCIHKFPKKCANIRLLMKVPKQINEFPQKPMSWTDIVLWPRNCIVISSRNASFPREGNGTAKCSKITRQNGERSRCSCVPLCMKIRGDDGLTCQVERVTSNAMNRNSQNAIDDRTFIRSDSVSFVELVVELTEWPWIWGSKMWKWLPPPSRQLERSLREFNAPSAGGRLIKSHSKLSHRAEQRLNGIQWHRVINRLERRRKIRVFSLFLSRATLTGIERERERSTSERETKEGRTALIKSSSARDRGSPMLENSRYGGCLMHGTTLHGEATRARRHPRVKMQKVSRLTLPICSWTAIGTVQLIQMALHGAQRYRTALRWTRLHKRTNSLASKCAHEAERRAITDRDAETQRVIAYSRSNESRDRSRLVAPLHFL